MSEQFIELRQTPVIWYEQIEIISKNVQKRISELNLENQLVTEDTVKSVKATRTELNKEFETFETQRKLIKERVYEPYKEFEDKYKEFIAKHYKNADDTLKAKILNFENTLKTDKENRLKDYFNELCQSKEINFVSFEKVGLKITNSASDKSLKEQILKFIEGIEKDLSLLKSYPFSDELKSDVLFEYKNNLDLSTSVRMVQEREKARKRAEEEALKKSQQTIQEPKVIQEEPAKEVLQAPKVEEVKAEEKTFTTSFKVKGTMEQLKALKQFILDNNIELITE